jgi:hypothetical protein
LALESANVLADAIDLLRADQALALQVRSFNLAERGAPVPAISSR